MTATTRRLLVTGLGRIAGVGLVVAYLLVGLGALSGLVLVFSPRSPPVLFFTGGSPAYRVVMGGLTVALVATSVRYGYYYFCWWSTRRDLSSRPAARATLPDPGRLPYVKFQITTKGGALPVVERSLVELDTFVGRHPDLRSRLSVEVVTEVAEEVDAIGRHFQGGLLPVTTVLLPPDYRTPNGTLLKARALHHVVELRRGGFESRPGRTFIVHLDEETLITHDQLVVLLAYLADDPRPVSEGPIFYPLEWRRTPWLCRSMESMRPFGCSECARVMKRPPPPHLHGSNLVVDEAVENELGWDFGTLDGQPLIAEDLVFGLRAFALLGKDGFGWHGATMLEQPPFSVYWAFRQRQRWVLGGLQALQVMRRGPEFSRISRHHRLRLQFSIAFRITTYALGFPVGLAGLTFLLNHLSVGPHPSWWTVGRGPWGLVIALGAAGWLVSYQIGLARNLRYLDMRWWERAVQRLGILALTPVAGLVETIGPFTAVTKWLLGIRHARWTPTAKVAEPAGQGR